MENIKELFDSATYGEILETKTTRMEPTETTNTTDYVSIYKDRLRKRHAKDEPFEETSEETSGDITQYEIDFMLLLEENGVYNKRMKYPRNISTLNGFDELSPASKKMIKAENSSNRQALIYDILRDDQKIETIEKKLNSMDEDFSFTLPSEVGNFMELWLCANMRCPGCKVGKLYKYVSSNMPVIDIRCVNPEHDLLNHGPLFYQIKATEKYTNFLGRKYFTRQPIINYPSGYIKVGSKRFGIFSHNIKTIDSLEDKYISIGYICVTYKYLTNKRHINIDLNDSFIVIPNLNYSSRTRSGDYYYKYIPNALNIVMISFNPDPNIVRVLTFNDFITSNSYNPHLFKNINLDNEYKTVPLIKQTQATRELSFDEPLDESSEYKTKYLYYKNKYLKLKYNYI